MARTITIGAAQMGPIQKAEGREAVVARMLALMDKAHAKGCDLIVFTELALTTFFPRYLMEDQDEVDQWFESSMPSNTTQPLFDRAVEYGMGFSSRLCRTDPGRTARRTTTTRRFLSTRPARSSPSTAKFTCRATLSSTPSAISST